MNELLNADSRALHAPFATVLATQTADEAFRWITAVLAAQTNNLRSANSHLVAYTGSDSGLNWYEANVGSPVTDHWGTGAALLGVPWPRVAAWLKSGGPRTLMALDALIAYRKPAPNMSPLARIAAPVLPEAPDKVEFERTLLDVLEKNSTPRIKSDMQTVMKYSEEILRRNNRGVAVGDLPLLFLNPEKFENAAPILDQHNSAIAAMRTSFAALIDKSR